MIKEKKNRYKDAELLWADGAADDNGMQVLPGDVIHIPANTKHWHGAAAERKFAHLTFETSGENTSNEWLEQVRDKK